MGNSSMFIGVLPYSHRHQADLSQTPLSLFQWMHNHFPPHGVVADLSASDHIVVSPSSHSILWGFGDLSCKVNLLLTEPKSIHGKYYNLLWLLNRRYHFVLCRYPDLVKRYDNVILFNSAEPWIIVEELPALDHQPPRKLCSIISSDKTDQIGHKLRHQVIGKILAKQLPVDVIGRGYDPFEHKWQGLLPYKYSIVIENAQESDYFTEKLLDAYLCGTIPIYWGTNDIGRYFDVEGIIICHSANDIIKAIVSLPENLDMKIKQAINTNKKLAYSYVNRPHRIAQTIFNQIST